MEMTNAQIGFKISAKKTVAVVAGEIIAQHDNQIVLYDFKFVPMGATYNFAKSASAIGTPLFAFDFIDIYNQITPAVRVANAITPKTFNDTLNEALNSLLFTTQNFVEGNEKKLDDILRGIAAVVMMTDEQRTEKGCIWSKQNSQGVTALRFRLDYGWLYFEKRRVIAPKDVKAETERFKTDFKGFTKPIINNNKFL